MKIAENQQGMLSIESRNIFTILKKWLYTEQDIVFRELISNAADAIEKLERLQSKESNHSHREGVIHVMLDADARKLIIRDNGIGMSEAEVHQYINQIAFSGAADFINHHDQLGKDTIIGHFGVGFYSAFMLSDHVTIETKSYRDDIPAVRWDCLSDMSYQMKPCDRNDIGTDVILHLSEENPYLKKPELIREIVQKFFTFSKTAIYYKAPDSEPVLMNDPTPLWHQPKELIDSNEMNTFYKTFFNDVNDPLFWIKFESIDIGLRGVFFFRNTRNGAEELDGTVKVYSRGVYVGENIQTLIPKFVNLQNGIIECDNLPLVVNRSSLREEETPEDMISLIYESLSQEVTIAMNEFFEKKRDQYESHWPHLNASMKYAVLQDKTFASVMTRKIIFQDLHGHYMTIQEYVDNVAATAHPEIIYYASDAIEQAHYIEIFKKCGLNALLFDHVIDQPFMRKYEVVRPGLKFIRIDSNIESLFQGYSEEGDEHRIALLERHFLNALGDRLLNMNLKITNLEHPSISTIIINDEKSRRMADMLEIYGFINPTDVSAKKIQAKSTLLINMKNGIIQYLLTAEEPVIINITINHLYDLALMSQQALKPEDIEAFINRSETILAASLNHQ
ncbi:molecular chaperone HtpG [Anoxynatronum buryatiense]|nr:molecular chaperone HtpG [Anoxynatronum buryatiense]